MQKLYVAVLRASIANDLKTGVLKLKGNTSYYTYHIMDGSKLNNILKCYFDTNFGINNGHVDDFGEGCLYVGKGKNQRKLQHAIECKQSLDDDLSEGIASDKSNEIAKLWKRGMGIAVMQLCNDSNHYEAHANDFALIKGIGLSNITNVINGTAYGAMKSWNNNEIINFGRMLLYNALVMCIHETPRILMYSDIVLPKSRAACRN